MEQIADVELNSGTTLERAAQTVAGEAGWHTDGTGAIYCDQKTYIGASLTEVGKVMERLGFINDSGSVFWEDIEKWMNDSEADEGFYKSLWRKDSPMHARGRFGWRIAGEVGSARRGENRRTSEVTS